MLPADSPRIESFVLRFVQDESNDGSSVDALASHPSTFDNADESRHERAHWHAVVVHVQTNEEKSFTDFADAVAFISRYVPIGKNIFTTEDTEGTDASRK